MYETAYGPRYHDLKALTGKDYPSAADIAKLIRADLKAGVASGDLPSTFAGYDVTYSVTVENYSGGRSIGIEVRGVPEAARTELRTDHFGYEVNANTDDANALLAKLKTYHWAYNYDGSDSQTDYYHVNYGGAWPGFESDWAAKERAAKAAKAKERKANPPAKDNRPSKRELVAHLRGHHRRAYGPKHSIDVMLAAHNFLHNHGKPLAIETAHTHDDDVFAPFLKTVETAAAG
jgi:hypothetical protein